MPRCVWEVAVLPTALIVIVAMACLVLLDKTAHEHPKLFSVLRSLYRLAKKACATVRGGKEVVVLLLEGVFALVAGAG